MHACAEATGKARTPSVERLVDGTTSMAVSRAQTASSVDVRCPERLPAARTTVLFQREKSL